MATTNAKAQVEAEEIKLVGLDELMTHKDRNVQDRIRLNDEVLKMVTESYFYDQDGDLRFRINLNNGTHISGYCDWVVETAFGPDETFDPVFFHLEKVLSENDRFYYMLCAAR